LDIRTIQVIATLLIVGVLFMAVLVYSEVTGFTPLLSEIKTGIEKLVGWFIPENYEVVITANATGVSVSGNTITLDGVNASGVIATVTVKFKGGGSNLKMAIVPDVTGGTVGVKLKSASNAVVAVTGNEVEIFPKKDANVEAVLEITLALTNTEANGTIYVVTQVY
jgi:hypothetical protein